MNDSDTKTIDESILAFERIIKYYEKQIYYLKSKKIAPCCFDEVVITKLKIKRKTK